MLRFIIIISTILLSACQSTNGSKIYYASEDLTTKGINQGLKQCKLESISKVPANTVVTTSPSYTTPVQCNTIFGNISCTGGDTYGGNVSSYDANAGFREEIRDDCLSEKGIIQLSDLPKCETWSLGGYYDGRLSAEELAAIQVGFENSLFTNQITEHYKKATAFNRYCLITPATDTMAGVTTRLASFPSNFLKSTSAERQGTVMINRWSYDEYPIPSHILFDDFDGVVASMQARIDFCTGKITEEELLNRYYPWVIKEKAQNVKNKVCVKGVAPI